MQIEKTDALAGLLFVGFGLFFGAQAAGLEMGTALRMGPGYFPLVLAGILILLGLVVLARSFSVAGAGVGALGWRGMAFILPAPIFFGLTVQGLGFVPSLFGTTLIAALASHRLRLPGSLLLAVAVTVFATLVFSYGLRLPFRRFGPWLDF